MFRRRFPSAQVGLILAVVLVATASPAQEDAAAPLAVGNGERRLREMRAAEAEHHLRRPTPARR